MEFSVFILCLPKPSGSHSKTFKQNSKQYPWSRISRKAPAQPASFMVFSQRNSSFSLLKPGSSETPFSYRFESHFLCLHGFYSLARESTYPLFPDFKKKIWLAYFNMLIISICNCFLASFAFFFFFWAQTQIPTILPRGWGEVGALQPRNQGE